MDFLLLLLPLLSVCLLSCSGTTSGKTVVRVNVGSEAVLPCLINPKRDITGDTFDWKKVDQNIFFYENSKHYNNGQHGQDEQFKGRVFHFPEQLKSSNASIVIRDTKLSDSGTYSCHFPHLQPAQTFTIDLVVGACPKPYVTTLEATNDLSILKCEVRGVYPKPTVQWRDSSGNNLAADEPQVTERGGRYDIIRQITVKKTNDYHCVVTQKEICHQISDKTAVNIPDPPTPEGFPTGWVVTVAVLLLVVLVLAGLLYTYCKKGRSSVV